MSRLRTSFWSIRSKLILLGAVPSVLVLLVVGSVFTVYDLISFRASIISELRAVAHMVAHASQASLHFRDSDRATEILKGLEKEPLIASGAIFDAKGELFAAYSRAGLPMRAFTTREAARGLDGDKWAMNVLEPAVFGETEIGAVYLEADPRRFWRRVRFLLLSTTGAVVVFSLIAYLLAARFQKHISNPLQQLASTAAAVSQNMNYSVRADEQHGPELSVLARAFNQMLSRIEQQDTALRQRTVQLESVNQELEAFTYTVSHDLRSPLRSMAGYAQLLRKSVGDTLSAENADFIARIQNNARRMSELIDDLLAFSRLDSQPIEKAEVDMDAIVDGAVETLKPQITPGKLQLKREPLPRGNADAGLIELVYVNILGNALKYSRTRSVQEIQIGSFSRDGKTVYYVRDNGVGFDMRYIDKLFGVFQQLHRAEEFEGTGVGLAIVQRIVHRHGGTIWAESAPDQGASFYFTLG